MPTLGPSVEFVGRTGELARLEDALGRASTGEASALVVGGESGVGKTRLVSEFLDSARRAGATVLVGGCIDLGDGGLPYWPVVDALRGLVRKLGPEPEDDVLGPLRPELSLLLPELATGEGRDRPPLTGPALTGPSAQGRLFELVLGIFERLAQKGPVVFVVEDLHWADRSTRDLLSFLVTNLREVPVVVIATYRSDALVSGHHLQPFLAELRRNRRAEMIDLPRFTRDEVVAQVTAILGAPPEPQLAETVWARSEGNAFFAEELLAASVDGSPRGLPQSLRQILLARVDGLSQVAQGVLRRVAAGGPRVAYRVLAATVSMNDDELCDALRECVDRHALVGQREGEAYQFRHALLREVVYGELLPGERTRFHAAYGRAIADAPHDCLGSAEAELAYHWYEAGEPALALPAAFAAAVAAERVYGYAEAQRHYERALELWDRVGGGTSLGASPIDVDRLGLFERAAEAANLAGDHARAIALVRAALSEGDGKAGVDAAEETDLVRRGLLQERLGCYLWAAGKSEAALAAYDEAAGLVPFEQPTAVRARVVAAQAQALMLAGRYRDSKERAEEALEVARLARARAEEGHVLATLGVDLAFLGHAAAGVTLLEEARAIAEEVGTPEDVARAWLNLAELLSGPLNRLQTAATVAEQGVERVGRLGLARSYGVSLQAIAVNTLFRLGRWTEADRFLADAMRCRPGGAAAIDLHLARAKLAVGRGQVEAAKADLAVVEELSAHAIDARYQAPLLTLRAGLALWEGDIDAARHAVATGLAIADRTDDAWFVAPLVWHGLRAEADRAELARARRSQREVEEARAEGTELRARVEALAAQASSAAPPVRQAVAAYLSLCLAEWSRVEGVSAPEAWTAAADRLDGLSQPYPAAYARMREAEALLSRRARSPRAADALAAAHRMAVELGALPFQRQIASLAARARITLDEPGPVADGSDQPKVTDTPRNGPLAPDTPHRRTPDALADLTRREREVLALVADGRSNREVAEALFISEKTASVHVSHILAKLGVQSRVQASAVAHRLGAAGET
ncbi:MAG: helix-turn-helix transcriptional regulator [Acidimicrobiales bacterium]